MTPDMWHLTPESWHMTCDLWHVSRDTQGVMNIVSKFQVPSFFGLGVKVSWRLWTKGSPTQLITKVFIEQPRLSRVCLIHCLKYRSITFFLFTKIEEKKIFYILHVIEKSASFARWCRFSAEWGKAYKELSFPIIVMAISSTPGHLLAPRPRKQFHAPW